VDPIGKATVHITSTPSGGEIYVDGKFYGNAPSDITLPAGEHMVKVTFGGKEWARAVQVTPGEIQLHASPELVTGTGGPTPVPTDKVTTVMAVAAPAAKSFTVQPVEPSKDAPSVTAPNSVQGWIGVTAKHFGSGGAVVTEVVAGGPAAKAGLRPGDVINAVNGISLKDEDLDEKIAAYKPGSTVRLGCMRGSWAMEAVVTVATNVQ
jgi:membrane-associated protease RseP (regulator of RpoE activity)